MAQLGPQTEYVDLQGKGKWVRPYAPDPKYGDYRMTLYPDAPSLDKIRDLQADGVKNVLKKDEDGYYIQWKRPTSKQWGSKVVKFSPPEVVDNKGLPMYETPIGNGSDVTVKLEVYGYKDKLTGKWTKAARWLGLRVDNLVLYDVNTDRTFPEMRAVKDFDKINLQKDVNYTMKPNVEFGYVD